MADDVSILISEHVPILCAEAVDNRSHKSHLNAVNQSSVICTVN